MISPGANGEVGSVHSRRARILRVLWIVLLCFNTVMLVLTLVWLLRGDPDGYHNQHTRLVSGSVTGILIALQGIVRYHRIVTWCLLTATVVSLVVQFWLAAG